MNCKTANNIDINYILKLLGYQPFKISSNCIWYLSPFRNEATPSFKTENNKFRDFGSGIYGGVVDFIVTLYKCSVNDALIKLDNLRPDFTFQKQNSSNSNHKTVTILEIKSLVSKPLFAYLNKRCISLDISAQLIMEVVFRIENGKTQYAIGFQSNSGWELRNSLIKICSKKDISLIRRNPSSNNNSVYIFEGFFDYLSLLTIINKQLDGDVMVLNSVVNLPKVIIECEKYEKIIIYGQNDNQGLITTAKIVEQFGTRAIDMSYKYKGFKDLNDFLINSKLRK